MEPTAAIIHPGTPPECVVDRLGRKIAIRNLTALDRLRIFKAAGPELSMNQPWLAVAVLASSVDALDTMPVPFPINEQQIESIVGLLGDAGLEAIAEHLDTSHECDEKKQVAAAGN